MQTLAQYVWSGFTSGCLIGLLALGFCLVYRATSIFHLAHACVYVASGYTLCLLLSVAALPAVFSVAAAVGFGVCLGVSIEKVIYLPLARRGGSWNVFFVTSLAVYIFLTNLFAAMWGNSTRTISPSAVWVWNAGLFTASGVQMAAVAALGVFGLLLWFLLARGRTGLAIRALGDNADLSAVLGLNSMRTRSIVFAIASLLAGVAGVLNAADVGVTPQSGLSPVLLAVLATMMAGRRSLAGTAAASLLLGLAQSLTVMFWSVRWQQVVVFAVLAVFLLVRGEGIVRRESRAEEK